jgi:subtilisin family serine protease
VSTGDPSVVVAVVDTGVDHNHEDLRANMWVNEAERLGVPGRDDDGNGYVDDVYGYNAVQNGGDPTDDVGHGTHVAGTIGAVGDNGLGVAGVNWNVKIMACKFMDATGAGYASDAIECLQYVKAMKDRGVNVVAANNSWGGGPYSRAMEDAVRSLGDILFVAAAGNDGANNDATPTYPACYDLPNVISVAAVDSADALAPFSNRGSRTVHVGAPGVDILSTLPGSVYGSMSGTSMASPHVAGLAALIRARYPTLDWRATKNLILSSGESLPALATSTATGKEINAAAALACANRTTFAVLKAPASTSPGVPAVLSALSVNCADPLAPVTVTLPDGQSVALFDDGIPPDLAAGDGVFSATWTPAGLATMLTFASPAGSETVSLAPGVALR